MKTRFLIKKTKALLVTNVITLLLVNVGGVGLFFTPKMAQAADADIAHASMSTSCTDITAGPIVGNGVTDLLDLSYFSDHYSSTASVCNNVDPRYVVWADFDGTGCIDDIDKEILATYFRSGVDNDHNYYCQQQNKSLKRECPDIDNSGLVNTQDLGYFGDAYGKHEGDPGYNSEADFDQDGYVSDIDKAIFTAAYIHPDVISPYCVYETPAETSSLTVIKHVINDNEGKKMASDFTMNVTGNSVSNPTFNGDETGTTVTLGTGEYSVKESNFDGYDQTFSDDCVGSIATGDHKTCTVTNNDKASTGDATNEDENGAGAYGDLIVKTPILKLTVTNDATTFVAPGGLVNYVATVKNEGGVAAEKVNVVANLPNGIFFTDTLGMEKTLASGGTLAPNDVMTLKYQGTIKNDTISGVYKDTVKVTSSNNSELNGGTSVEVRVPVAEVSKITTLGVTIQADVPFANPGDTVKYTVNVSNTGIANAVDVHLIVTLPVGQTFAETGTTTREWTLGDIAVGAKNAVAFDGLVSATASAGIGKISATATSVSISAPVTATMDLEIKLPQVLGAEITPETPAMVTLPATGMGIVDYLILLSVSTIGLLLGARWWRLRHHTGYAAGK